MSEKRFIVETVEIIDCDTGKSRVAKVITDTKELCSCDDLYELCDDLNKLAEKNEQLHYKLKQTEQYLQTKIAECKNPKKMKEIVFGVEQAKRYEKALLQFQKGLKRRLNDE